MARKEAPEAFQGCDEGLFEKLDWSKITDKNKLVKGAAFDCGAGVLIWSTVFAYDADKIKDGPKNWTDFWNVKKWPGKRGMRRGAKITLDNGEKVAALAVNAQGAGERTMLSIRPERVLIDPDESSVPHPIDAQVQELIYLGDHIRCRMTVAGNDEFIVKVANAPGNRRLSVGEKVRIGWMTDDCRALDAD